MSQGLKPPKVYRLIQKLPPEDTVDGSEIPFPTTWDV